MPADRLFFNANAVEGLVGAWKELAGVAPNDSPLPSFKHEGLNISFGVEDFSVGENGRAVITTHSTTATKSTTLVFETLDRDVKDG